MQNAECRMILEVCDISCGNVTFLSPNKKVTKEVGIGEGVELLAPASKATLPYVPLPARTYDGSGAP